jgi:hypothetical protein
LRLFALLLVGALALALTPVCPAARAGPKHPETDAQRAKAVGLTLADLGLEWTDNLRTSSPSPIDVSTFGGGGGIACGASKTSSGSRGGRATAGAVSEFVTGGGAEVVYSVVILFKTASDARGDWQKANAGPLAKCLQSAFLSNVSSPNWTTRVVSSGRRAFATGAPLTVPYRVVARITTTSRVLLAYYDAFLQTGGRAEVATTITSYSTPPPDALERQLVRTLAARLRTG